jgi:hypothetical protein
MFMPDGDLATTLVLCYVTARIAVYAPYQFICHRERSVVEPPHRLMLQQIHDVVAGSWLNFHVAEFALLLTWKERPRLQVVLRTYRVLIYEHATPPLAANAPR